MKHATFAAALIIAQPAFCDVSVVFSEGAPKDRFTLTNTGACPLGPMNVTLDISTAPSGLIFDVTESGAGVEVFQPFELISGQSLLATQPSVKDGQQSIIMGLSGLAERQVIAFTIDVDDTTSDHQITVSGSEIAGASLRIEVDGIVTSGQFGDDATASVALTNCVS